MAGQLDHSPDNILRHLLIGLGVGTLPSAQGTWPISASVEPNSPDNVITTYNTTPLIHGRVQHGETQQHYGAQIRVRAAGHSVGYVKANSITQVLDGVSTQYVTVDSSNYLVWATHHRGILSLGREVDQSRRHVFTINLISSIRKIS